MLAALFEWGVAFHDLDFEAIRKGEKSKEQVKRELKGMARQGPPADRQGLRRLPGSSRGLAAARHRGGAAPVGRTTRAERRRPGRARRAGLGETFRATLKANVTANIVRNVWSYAIIFCGHFPDQTYTFSQEEVEDESRGGCYVRQLLGAANIEGSPLFHVDQRQPRLPGRAPPLPGHAEHPLRRDRPAGEGDLRALRAALQHRARSSSSSARCSARSCAWRSRAASRDRSPGRIPAPTAPDVGGNHSVPVAATNGAAAELTAAALDNSGERAAAHTPRARNSLKRS